jgi:REP element-mobilizing transposase RayT
MDSDPLAYFITWTCYGTWLPGDDRGWTKWHKGEVIPQPLLANWCLEKMTDDPLFLTEIQRIIVNETVALHCQIRRWNLHAVNCRSNHCHTVITASDYDGEQVRDQLKSWCKRKLKEEQKSRGIDSKEIREKWWTGKGSARWLFDQESLEAAIRYTLEAQDLGGSSVF